MSANFNKVKAGEFTIVHDDLNTWLDKSKIEKKFSAKYIGEFTLKTPSNYWANQPISIFYQEEIPEKYKGVASNHFGIYCSPMTKKVFITNAKAAVDNIWNGVLLKDSKEILYSAFRHDYQHYKGLIIDGGPDYIKCSPHPVVKFKIVKDKIEMVDSLGQDFTDCYD